MCCMNTYEDGTLLLLGLNTVIEFSVIWYFVIVLACVNKCLEPTLDKKAIRRPKTQTWSASGTRNKRNS